MKQVPFNVLMHTESALTDAECAMAVLDLWINSLPSGEEYREESCRVGAVITLLNRAISELVKAQEADSENNN